MTVATRERVKGKAPFTSEQAAQGGRAKKGKSVKMMHDALAEEITKDAERPANKRRTKEELLRVAGYTGIAGKQKAEVWNTQGLREALARRGFGQDKMMKVLQEAAEAKIVTVFKGEAKETEAPDHAIRLRAVDQVADVMGLKKMNVQTINVDVKMEADDLKTMLGF